MGIVDDVETSGQASSVEEGIAAPTSMPDKDVAGPSRLTGDVLRDDRGAYDSTRPGSLRPTQRCRRHMRHMMSHGMRSRDFLEEHSSTSRSVCLYADLIP